MDKRVLVVLGASGDQRFLIKTAQDMGLHVLAFDFDENAAARHEADDFALVSTRDVEALTWHLDDYKAQGHDIAGVITMGSDISQIVAALAKHLGTPGQDLEKAMDTVDKVRMKDRFKAAGVPIPWYQELTSFADLEAVMATRGDALILKPVDRSGSRGVVDLRGAKDVRALYDEARDLSFEHRVMVEELLEGPQQSTETIMYQGRGITPGFSDRNYEMNEKMRPQIMENGGVVPTRLAEADRLAVEDLLVRSALALGIRDGVAKGDAVLTADGPKMIEMASRLSGGDFCESLVPLGVGVNYVKSAIQIAIGEAPDFSELEPKFYRPVANRYFFPKPGRLVRIDGVDDVRAHDWVKKLEFWYAPGDVVPEVTNHANRFGVCMIVADTYEELEGRIAYVYDTIRIITEPV